MLTDHDERVFAGVLFAGHNLGAQESLRLNKNIRTTKEHKYLFMTSLL